MKRMNACIAIVMALMILSCNKGANSREESKTVVQNVELMDVKSEGGSVASDSSAVAVSQPPQQVGDKLNSGSPVNPDWDKKIIKTADVRLEVKDYNSYNLSIHKELKNYGAYISSEEQNQSEDGTQNSMTIKVPVEKFEDLMNTFAGEGIKVIQRKINTSDVTGEVVDTKGRLEAKKQARDKYLQLLKNAKNMKEILEVQGEINSIEEELESAGGRINYLVHEAAYSTINLTYYHGNDLTGYNGQPAFSTKLQEAFKTGSSIITGLLLFIVTIWPLILLSVAVWLLVKRSRFSTVKVLKKG